MTQVTTAFHWNGPVNVPSDPTQAALVHLTWEQTKAILEELNQREPERTAVYSQALPETAPDFDLGGITILAGCLAGFIKSMPDEHAPQALDFAVRIAADQVVPEGLRGSVLFAMAVKTLVAEGINIAALEPFIKQLAKIVLQHQQEHQRRQLPQLDDQQADAINQALDRLRRGR